MNRSYLRGQEFEIGSLSNLDMLHKSMAIWTYIVNVETHQRKRLMAGLKESSTVPQKPKVDHHFSLRTTIFCV